MKRWVVNKVEKSTIRLVQESDTREILEIYEPYIKDTAITFEYEVPSVDTFWKRISDISSDYPYLVYLKDDKIVGYTYAHRQKERAAYQWNAELSAYVDKAYLRMGIGKDKNPPWSTADEWLAIYLKAKK